MARTDSLSNFLTDIATAIKEKKGDDSIIIAEDFDTEIANISMLNGEQVTITPSTSQQTIVPSQGKNAITQVTVNAVTSAIDINIQAKNIKKDVVILGVTGTYEDTGDTSDATAVSNDIISGKTAYIATGKVTGTLNISQDIKGIDDPDDIFINVNNDIINLIVPIDTNTNLLIDDTTAMDVSLPVSVLLRYLSALYNVEISNPIVHFNEENNAIIIDGIVDVSGKEVINDSTNARMTISKTDILDNIPSLIELESSNPIVHFNEENNAIIIDGIVDVSGKEVINDSTNARMTISKTDILDNIPSLIELENSNPIVYFDEENNVIIINSIVDVSGKEVINSDTNIHMRVTEDSIVNAINLTSDDIIASSTILGITGNTSNVNTSDADATATDIAQGKTAYVNGVKIIGTHINTYVVPNGMKFAYSTLTNLSNNLDTSNVTDMRNMFYNCTELTTIPLIDTSNVTDMRNMFTGCAALTVIPLLNTSSVTNMAYMFNDCVSLTTIPLMNTSNITNMDFMFNGCIALTDVSLDNILQMCINATNYAGVKKLYNLGFRNTDYSVNKIQTLTHYQDFINAGWEIGY